MRQKWYVRYINTLHLYITLVVILSQASLQKYYIFGNEDWSFFHLTR